MRKLYFLLIVLSGLSNVNAQIVNIPDSMFKAKLLQASTSNQIAKDANNTYISIDTNGDRQIQASEALRVVYLDLRDSVQLNHIISLEGISSFTNLKTLDCSYHDITSLDLTVLPNLFDLNCSFNDLNSLSVNGSNNLQTLRCGNNNMTTLELSNLPRLRNLLCDNNLLTSLDLSNSVGDPSYLEVFCQHNQISSLNFGNSFNLQRLDCSFNQLSTLNLGNNLNLKDLYCSFNQLSTLNVNSFTNLQNLNCDDNQLADLNIANLSLLTDLKCRNNLITSLDISNVRGYIAIRCENNRLESLFVKNGYTTNSIVFSGNPTMKYICIDEAELAYFQDLISQYSYTNCNINSYCSFVPGGVFYTVNGATKLDLDNNGCTSSDFNFSNLKFKITRGSVTGDIISDNSGNYSIPIQSGTYTITPILENPTYFTISPSSFNVTFPAQTSPFTQNFCVTVSNPKPDLEITLLPLQAARPGFNVKYKIIYKNKGNIIQSGAINLAFNDAILDLVSANPVIFNQTTNNLSWNFSSLYPLESREIILTFNLNSPIETPAVNGGDILNYTASITSPATDVDVNDNISRLNQLVVNSLDPNDKTCLEGATIAPSQVGKYVHYMIRFENTGTFPAENIVVKDMVDTNKFDINSLVPLKGSHSFVTNITSGNKVEFIFENINLPFDDANNDGYVAFKIKTKPSLVVGNTFSNSASIYFDYNFPIVTNTATTTIQALSNQDFSFATYFTLYPNPVKDVLNIETKQTIEVSSINIYNQLGQLVLVVPNAQNVSKVDVSSLASGNYFIKINSDKGTSNTKFIKQ